MRSKEQQQVIQAAASGDREAFRSLVLAHQSNVRGLLLRLTGFDSHRADDLAQDVFILLFQKLSSFRFEADFKSWLYKITYNAFLDDQRKYGKRVDVEMDEGEFLSGADDTLDIQSVLKKALIILKADERTAVVLTAVEEFTQEEAAETMGIPLGTLKSHVLRGKEQMRKVFVKHGMEVSL